MHDVPPRQEDTASLSVHYREPRRALALLRTEKVLGVVGYGVGRPDVLEAGLPFVPAPVVPAADGPVFEVWMSDTPTRPCGAGAVVGACGETAVFGMVTIVEDGAASLEAAVETAYLAAFDFLEEAGFPAPLRFWNYLDAITAQDGGLERYRRFNIGRHRAFMARLRQAVPPAASGIGGTDGASVIYFLGGREAAKAVENPRQVSAYDYPPVYGPASPSFSRAAIRAGVQERTLFISGTASIVGHETLHADDLAGQIAETAENLRALIAAAGQMPMNWRPKIYLREAGYRTAVAPMIDAVFGVTCERLYLVADLCRRELLLEVEAVGSGIVEAGDRQA